MPETGQEGPEERLRALWEAGDMATCATEALAHYGREIFGYLLAVARDQTDASEAFSAFSEDMWKGLPRFRWQASFRTWAYALARQALLHVRRDPAARPGRRVPLSQAPEVWNMVEQVRTSTLRHQRTEGKAELARLRAALDADDQTLLILRVDRKMTWLEAAAVFSGEDAGDDALAREAAALRKRYERIKRRLREQARAHKIVE